MPLCMKVESPITATVFFSVSFPRAALKPWMPETLAPMHSVESRAFSGATAPRV